MATESQETVLKSAAVASGLVSAPQLDYCLRVARHRMSQQGVSADDGIPDELLSELLVEQGVLTKYQVDQLVAGRTKLNLGPYIVTDWIGQGGMGQVFKAIHQVMGRECAVKVLPLTRATQEARDSFAREIRMQAGLDCPYLVRAFDAGQDGNVHYLVTEYVPGMDLRRLVKSRGALPVGQAAKILMQAALGLAYAHHKGLVHRDVKPGNILVTPDGDAKVSDVGLAGFAQDLVSDPRAGKIVGTTDYLSPEQIRTPLDIQATSDIYSLGCTLYYAVCGKVPFPGGDTNSKLKRHLEATPWHPRKFVSDISEDFVDIIADMMEKDASKRITSADEVASRLEPWVGDAWSNGAVSMRSPWMAPPLPSPDEESEEAQEIASESRTPATPIPSLVSESASKGNTDNTHSNGSSLTHGNPSGVPSGIHGVKLPPGVPGSPHVLEALQSSSVPRRRRAVNKGLIVAITIALVLPPALLVGAILGFLAAQ